MNYDQFWFGEPMLAKAFREAHRLKNEQRNQELWLQGYYIYDAFAVVLSNAFGGKGHKKQKYLDKPIDIGAHEKTEEEKIREQDAAKNKLIATLNAMKINFDARHKG